MARYALAEHVFVCVNGDHLVILDLKEDRYWALEAVQTASLGTLVSGWPVREREREDAAVVAEPDASSEETEALIDLLKGRGILADGIPPGKNATPVAPEPPGRELASDCDNSEGPRAGNWFSFLAACVFAKMALRMWPFERVIARVRRRKASNTTSERGMDVELARKLVESFLRYRVFVFSPKNECLFDSLALIEFLARYGLHGDWIFGVQTRPFAAHCWVQHGDIVFNDTAEHVSGYTPIMVV